MGNIDIAAIKKFQALWEPVMSAIPAVIDMAEHQEDVARGLALETKRLADVQASIAATVSEGEATIARLKAEVEDIANKRNADLDAFRSNKQALADELTAAKDAFDDELKTYKAVVLGAKKAAADVETKYAAMQGELQKAHDARVVALEEEIKAIEVRRKSAERTLDTLRAKLG